MIKILTLCLGLFGVAMAFVMPIVIAVKMIVRALNELDKD